MSTEPELNHISFRPGELRERLTAGLLASGTKAKRDLIRYYKLMDATFDQWWDRRRVDDDQWFFVATFVKSRAWKELPTPRAFLDAFEGFMDGVVGIGYPRGTKSLAVSKVADLSFAEMLAIIDRAQDEVGVTRSARPQTVASGGPTSVAS